MSQTNGGVYKYVPTYGQSKDNSYQTNTLSNQSKAETWGDNKSMFEKSIADSNDTGSNNTYDQAVKSNYKKPDSGGFDMGALGGGFKIATGVANLWLGYQNYKAVKEQNALAKESFEFNKDMSTKNFNIAKEDRDRRIERSSRINDTYRNIMNDGKDK